MQIGSSTWLSLLVCIMVFMFNVRAQVFQRENYTIPVNAESGSIDHPFGGGFYNPVHQFVDIDGDDDLDLFILDKADGSVGFYRNLGTTTRPMLRFERPSFTMPRLVEWFRFADVNGDGKIDVLTSSDTANTVAIYHNIGTPQLPHFVLSAAALRDSAGSFVFSQTQCIPALADINGDGTLDFFSLNPDIGTINYYENIGSVTNFRLALRTNRYQNIQICPGCDGLAPNARSLHGQGTMCFADVDGDGDLDMFYGDLFDSGVLFFQNNGTRTHAIFDSASSRFPPVSPVITNGFNQPSFVDIDGNGVLDLFVSVLPPLQRTENFWFYFNTGTPTNFTFEFVTKNYLNVLDFGIQSVPSFVDIDGNGTMDLFIGDLDGRVAYLQNSGTVFAPAFFLVDSAFVKSSSRFTYAPTFADIDGDGDYDMFLGHFSGSVEFHRNIGSAAAPEFRREISFFDSIGVGLYAAPAFFDIDNDGDLDFFVGRSNGRISFFRNNGDATSPAFLLESSSFQNISVGFNAKPVFADLDVDGDGDLLVGAGDGRLFFFRNDGPMSSPMFALVTDRFGPIDVSREIAPAIADIDGDGDPDLLIGQVRGGIEFYRNMLITSAPTEREYGFSGEFQLLPNYPNPFNPSTTIEFVLPATAQEMVTLKVFDMLGRTVATVISEELPGGRYRVDWRPLNLSSGIYIVQLQAGLHRQTRKLTLIR